MVAFPGRVCYQRRVRLFRSRRLIHALIGGVVFLTIACLYRWESHGLEVQVLNNAEYWFRDNILAAEGRHAPADSRLVFLGLDNASRTLTSIDLKTFVRDLPPEAPEYRALELMTAPFPWSREVYALLCERLLTTGARAVVFDMTFPQPRPGDDALQEVLRKFPGRIVLGADVVVETISPGGEQAPRWVIPATSILPDSSPEHASVGYVTFPGGFKGIIRKAQYHSSLDLMLGAPPAEGTGSAPASVAFRMASKLKPIALSKPFEPRLFRYAGPAGTFPVIPLVEVFLPSRWEQNLQSGAWFRDKVVLVGAAGSIAHDELRTPFGVMPGPEVHLNAANALVHEAFVQELPAFAAYLLIVSAVIAAWLLTAFVTKTWLRVGAFVLSGLGYLYAVYFIYDHANTIVVAFPPVLAFAAAGLVSFAYDFTHETLEKLRIRRTLEAYVSKDVVREVLDNPASYLSKLGGERANVGLIITDLRGFTTMSEEMDSHQLVVQLNEYLSLMVDDIFSRRGSVDKFIGDAILAVWGHVKSEGASQDSILAIEAALLMKESLRQLNADWARRGLRTFEMGIGVNFGEVIFGNIGSSRKMEPTVIGDAVNVTSRLEGLTKEYGRDLLIGEGAVDLAKDAFTFQFVDRVTMKGKTKPLRIYSVVAKAGVALDPQTTAYLDAYSKAQASYSAGDFKEAKAQFEDCVRHAPDDQLLQVYIERCTELIERPGEGEWTGVHVATHK
ncbi:MAG TPA: adenylate/guanylate cyclase domain-containing protein [Chthoniobacterales bacterium]|nr:adenylate/guanylate cyclase domain-containing protein [Chthoniobacterales bacterium]